MPGFCQHCGKELNGDEPYCPECGSPTGFYAPQQTYAPRKNKGTGVAIVIVVMIVVASIAAIAMIPFFVDNTPQEKYTVTITVESVSVEAIDTSYYSSPVRAYIGFSCRDTNTVNHEFGPWIAIPVNGTEVPVLTNNKLTLTVTGNPTDIKYTAFLYIKDTMALDSRVWDYADLYDVTSEVKPPITTPHYYGCSGVSFTVDNYDGSTMTFKGDSDPIGCIKMSFTAVKN
jgi:hypothetical protein